MFVEYIFVTTPAVGLLKAPAEIGGVEITSVHRPTGRRAECTTIHLPPLPLWIPPHSSRP